MYLARYLEGQVQRLSAGFPVVLVTGPRQAGKTTLLRHLREVEGRERGYVSLDEFAVRALAQDDPALLLQRYPPPVVLDEIQHAPNLFNALKPVVDRAHAPGGYWLTGSQHFPLMKGVSESLAGRVGVAQLTGLSTAEEHRVVPQAESFRPDRVQLTDRPALNGLLSIYARIVRGSLPRLVHPDAPPWEAYYGSYLQTYIERDVRALTNVSQLATFRRFLTVAASRVGQLLNYSDIARDVGIAVSTAREWLHLLEATYQVYLLRPYFENIGKRQLKTPKLFFRDTGLVCYLTGWRTAETAASGAMAGPLLECHVVGELLRSYEHRGREAPLWSFRTKEGREVDILIADEGKLFPVEVKRTASPTTRDLDGIRALERTGAPLGQGALVCCVERPVPLSRFVDAIPVGALS